MMNRRIYWGIATLIVLLIGVSSVLMMRTTDTESERIYKLPTAEEVDQSRQHTQDAIDQSKKNQPLIAEVDRPNVETEKPQAVEKLVPEVTIVKSDEDLLATAELNLVKSFELPTNAELERYSKSDIDALIVKMDSIISTIKTLTDHYENQIESLRETEMSILHSTDYADPKRKELRNQRKQLETNYYDLGSEKERFGKEYKHIRQYKRSLNR